MGYYLVNIRKGMKEMATKSFTNDVKFDKKSVNSLIETLNNDKSPNTKSIKSVKIIYDSETIKEILGLNK